MRNGNQYTQNCTQTHTQTHSCGRVIYVICETLQLESGEATSAHCSGVCGHQSESVIAQDTSLRDAYSIYTAFITRAATVKDTCQMWTQRSVTIESFSRIRRVCHRLSQ